MAVSQQELKRIARLARLKLSPEEERRFAQELSSILEAMAKLTTVATDQIAPADLPPAAVEALRPDQPRERGEAAAILENAPQRTGRAIRLSGWL